MQVMKNAFAMRSNLGDPGVCKAGDIPGSADTQCFQDLSKLLTAMLSPAYADTLKYDTRDSLALAALYKDNTKQMEEKAAQGLLI